MRKKISTKQHIRCIPNLAKIKNVKIDTENNLEKDIKWLTEERNYREFHLLMYFCNTIRYIYCFFSTK